MPNPFPGIDPYLEAQGYWPDFHHRFIADCSDQLGGLLPDQYEARIDERIKLLDLPDDEEERPRSIKPDVAVVGRSRPMGAGREGGVAVLEEVDLEPVTIPNRFFLDIRERFIKVLHREDRSLVTVIEVLSPENKSSSGQSHYLAKQREVFARPIHLVELDFLAGGHRLPMARPLPSGDAYALVSRWDRRPDCEVYAWSIRRRLPKIRLPLRAPDPDLVLDLVPAYATTYQRGRYDRSIDRAKPLTMALGPEDRAWAEGLAKAPAR